MNGIQDRKTHEEELYRRGLRLEYFTVGYNLLEAAASITAGKLAGSVSLIGFGMDSIVESLSGVVMIWRLSVHDRIEKGAEEKLERRVKRIIGLTFVVLALYVLFESIRKIVLQEMPDPSFFGIAIAASSLIVMPILARMKHTTGKALGLGSLVADAKETIVCSFLSFALLTGLVVRIVFGFGLADPIVGFLIVLYLLKEGFELVFERNGSDE